MRHESQTYRYTGTSRILLPEKEALTTTTTTMTFLSNQIETNGAAVNYTIYINECVVTSTL